MNIPVETPFGRFAIMAFAQPTHAMRGGSSFVAKGGQGFLWVKRLHDDHLPSCGLARSTISGRKVQINHYLKCNGHICRIPGFWPLGDEVRNAVMGRIALTVNVLVGFYRVQGTRNSFSTSKPLLTIGWSFQVCTCPWRCVR